MAHFSIRGLLATVAFVAVACAALKYAGPVWWTIVSGAALLLFIGSAVVVVASRGEQRVKAVSFILAFAIYTALVAHSDNELQTRTGYLPTTKIMRPTVLRLVRNRYVDLATGELLVDYSPDKQTRYVSVEPSYAPGDGLPLPTGIRSVGVYSLVDGKDIMRIAHALWAILLGFLASAFASFVYRRNHPVAKPDAI